MQIVTDFNTAKCYQILFPSWCFPSIGLFSFFLISILYDNVKFKITKLPQSSFELSFTGYCDTLNTPSNYSILNNNEIQQSFKDRYLPPAYSLTASPTTMEKFVSLYPTLPCIHSSTAVHVFSSSQKKYHASLSVPQLMSPSNWCNSLTFISS